MRAARGAALLLVLWLVLLLSGLVAGYALSARVESMQGNGAARGVVAQEAARAGIEYAVSRLLDPDPARRWVADGRRYRFALDGVAVELAVRDEAAKIDQHSPGRLDHLASWRVHPDRPRFEHPCDNTACDWEARPAVTANLVENSAAHVSTRL